MAGEPHRRQRNLFGVQLCCRVLGGREWVAVGFEFSVSEYERMLSGHRGGSKRNARRSDFQFSGPIDRRNLVLYGDRKWQHTYTGQHEHKRHTERDNHKRRYDCRDVDIAGLRVGMQQHFRAIHDDAVFYDHLNTRGMRRVRTIHCGRRPTRRNNRWEWWRAGPTRWAAGYRR
jgi:hypothetical protein